MGVHLVCWGVLLQIFPQNFAFFTALGCAGAPTAPPGYAYATTACTSEAVVVLSGCTGRLYKPPSQVSVARSYNKL